MIEFEEIITKKEYCSEGFLEYISATPLKNYFKELDLLMNFVKSELLHKWFLRILDYGSFTCHYRALLHFCFSYSHW